MSLFPKQTKGGMMCSLNLIGLKFPDEMFCKWWIEMWMPSGSILQAGPRWWCKGNADEINKQVLTTKLGWKWGVVATVTVYLNEHLMSASSSPKCHWVNTLYALYALIDFVAKMALHHLVLSPLWWLATIKASVFNTSWSLVTSLHQQILPEKITYAWC